jgi:hypothetical protein
VLDCRILENEDRWAFDVAAFENHVADNTIVPRKEGDPDYFSGIRVDH